MCTNALLLEEKLDLFKPSKYLSFSVHVDGEGNITIFQFAARGVTTWQLRGFDAAVARGFRVTTNTTLFDGADPNSVRTFFDEMMELGVEDMMLSPGYSYDKAPDQSHFLGRAARAACLGRSFRTASPVGASTTRHSIAIFDGQTQLCLYALGHADLQCFRLAEALLPAAGWLCGYVCRS